LPVEAVSIHKACANALEMLKARNKNSNEILVFMFSGWVLKPGETDLIQLLLINLI
jgi:hypothetical protein